MKNLKRTTTASPRATWRRPRRSPQASYTLVPSALAAPFLISNSHFPIPHWPFLASLHRTRKGHQSLATRPLLHSKDHQWLTTRLLLQPEWACRQVGGPFPSGKGHRSLATRPFLHRKGVWFLATKPLLHRKGYQWLATRLLLHPVEAAGDGRRASPSVKGHQFLPTWPLLHRKTRQLLATSPLCQSSM